MDEKRRFSFANSLHLFIPWPSLTHSAFLEKRLDSACVSVLFFELLFNNCLYVSVLARANATLKYSMCNFQWVCSIRIVFNTGSSVAIKTFCLNLFFHR